MADGSSPALQKGQTHKLRITSPNDSSGPAKQPVHLFDEFWLQGEIALLFGGSGKSTLAVHIAESISRGKPLWGEKMVADPQTVLYLDLQMTADQFRARYFVENSDETGVLSRTEHIFSENFKRVEMPDSAIVSGADYARELGESLAWLVNETGAKVLIIDSITAFRGSAGGTAGELMIIRELSRLKCEYGLSILVVLNREVRPNADGLSVRNLGSSAILANFVDSVFAIGQAGTRGPYRYIKHLRARGVEITYDGDHTPTFRIARDDGPFRFFEFISFADENRQFDAFGSGMNYQNLVQAFLLHDEGVSIRDIADDLGLSKSKVHRLLKMKRPPMPKDPESAEEAADAPKTEGSATPEHAQSVESEETGEPQFSQPPVGEPEASADEKPAEHSSESPKADPPSPYKMGIDDGGDEIFIEKEDENGRPIVWYKLESGGSYYRRERSGGTIFLECVGRTLPGFDPPADEPGSSP